MSNVVRIIQSPLNPRQWSLELDCCHDKVVTSFQKPTCKEAECDECRRNRAPERCRYCRGKVAERKEWARLSDGSVAHVACKLDAFDPWAA